MMSVISLKDVGKSFKGQVLYKHVNLNFEKGKAYGIVGPNGIGKSVLFKIICGFVFPDEGSVLINGKEINQRGRFPKDFGIIIDRPGFINNKTGYENLAELASIQNKVGRKEIVAAMETVGLPSGLKQVVRHYSLGMKQKLAIAQAIMEDQSVLILDEVFNGLDADSVQKIRRLLVDYRQKGKTILMTSHHSEDISAVCDEIYRVNQANLERVSSASLEL